MSKIAELLIVVLATVALIAALLLAITIGILLISSFCVASGYVITLLFGEKLIGHYEASLLNLISLAILVMVACFLALRTRISQMAERVSELSSFGEDEEDFDDEDFDDYDDDDYEDDEDDDDRLPKIIRGDWAERRVGRNEKCPCGSGKKFKNCCGRYL